MIVNCGKNEYGGTTGGQAGDQTGQEFWKINWYNFSPDCVLRYPSQSVGHLIADLAEEAAENDLIGYDQTTRLSFYEQLKQSGWHPKNITTACAADCSSATAAIVIAAGHLLYDGMDEVIADLQQQILDADGDTSDLETQLANAEKQAQRGELMINVSPSATTWSLETELYTAGFASLSASKYLTGDSYLLRGDIILNTSSHVCINVSTGANARTEEQDMVIITPTKTEEDTTTIYDGETYIPTPDGGVSECSSTAYLYVQYGDGLNTKNGLPRVKAIQALLVEHGYSLDIDGEYGRFTEKAVAAFQDERGLEINGIVDEAVWLELVKMTV